LELVPAGIGLVTGLLVGLTGVGGGAVMTPLLLMHGGVGPLVAVGTDLWCAAVTKAAASPLHHRTGLIEWPVVRRLWMGSLPASALSLLWLGAYGGRMTGLTAVIGAAVVVSAIGIAAQARLHAIGRSLRTADAQRFKRMQAPLTVLAGVILGVLVTLTSVGAGALGAVALAYLYPFRLTPPRLVASDIAHAVPLALCAGLGHLMIGNVDGGLLGLLLAGSIPGVLAGAWLSSRMPHRRVRHLLAAVLLLAGGRLIWMAL
jgi:hypothetical protein